MTRGQGKNHILILLRVEARSRFVLCCVFENIHETNIEVRLMMKVEQIFRELLFRRFWWPIFISGEKFSENRRRRNTSRMDRASSTRSPT